jgi:hypothetical protein
MNKCSLVVLLGAFESQAVQRRSVECSVTRCSPEYFSQTNLQQLGRFIIMVLVVDVKVVY